MIDFGNGKYGAASVHSLAVNDDGQVVRDAFGSEVESASVARASNVELETEPDLSRDLMAGQSTLDS